MRLFLWLKVTHAPRNSQKSYSTCLKSQLAPEKELVYGVDLMGQREKE